MRRHACDHSRPWFLVCCVVIAAHGWWWIKPAVLRHSLDVVQCKQTTLLSIDIRTCDVTQTPWRLVEICNVSVITVWTVYLQYTSCLLPVNTSFFVCYFEVRAWITHVRNKILTDLNGIRMCCSRELHTTAIVHLKLMVQLLILSVLHTRCVA